MRWSSVLTSRTIGATSVSENRKTCFVDVLSRAVDTPFCVFAVALRCDGSNGVLAFFAPPMVPPRVPHASCGASDAWPCAQEITNRIVRCWTWFVVLKKNCDGYNVVMAGTSSPSTMSVELRLWNCAERARTTRACQFARTKCRPFLRGTNGCHVPTHAVRRDVCMLR